MYAWGGGGGGVVRSRVKQKAYTLLKSQVQQLFRGLHSNSCKSGGDNQG